MTWWVWMVLGAILFVAEIFAIDAQFYLVFIGISAALVGLAGMLGIAMPEWGQWLAFAALSLISMFTFRRALYEKIRGQMPGFKESLDDEFIVVDEVLAPGQQCRTEFRGTDWTVVNEGGASIDAGTRIKVNRFEGLTLYVGSK